MKMKRLSEIAWATGGASLRRRYLYTGTWRTRREAIEFHVGAKGKSWADCHRDGDFTLRVRVIETAKGADQ